MNAATKKSSSHSNEPTEKAKNPAVPSPPSRVISLQELTQNQRLSSNAANNVAVPYTEMTQNQMNRTYMEASLFDEKTQDRLHADSNDELSMGQISSVRHRDPNAQSNQANSTFLDGLSNVPSEIGAYTVVMNKAEPRMFE